MLRMEDSQSLCNLYNLLTTHPIRLIRDIRVQRPNQNTKDQVIRVIC